MNTVEHSVLLKELNEHKGLQKNLYVPILIEKISSRNEGRISETVAVSAHTGKYTGRSPKDRFVVKDKTTEDIVDWGNLTQPIDPESFDKLYEKVISYLKGKEEIFQFRGFAGAAEKYRLPIQVFNEYACHNLFACQLFILPTEVVLINLQSVYKIYSDH